MPATIRNEISKVPASTVTFSGMSRTATSSLEAVLVLQPKMLKEKMIHAMEESNHPPLLGTLSFVIVSVCLVVETDKSVGLPVLSLWL